MRGYLASLSPWRAALLSGAFWVVWTTGWDAVEFHESVIRASVGALIGAGLFVPFMWYALHRQQVRTTWVIGRLSEHQRRAVVSAAATGAPPADPELCPAAVALARYRLQRDLEYRTAALITMSLVGVVLVIGFVLAGSPWLAAGATIDAALLISTALSPMIQRRRIGALEAASVAPTRCW